MFPAQARKKRMRNSSRNSGSFALAAKTRCEWVVNRCFDDQGPPSFSNRKGRLSAVLTVPVQWSYLEYGQKNVSGRESPGRNPGGRIEWNAS
ncbi:MAG: hypothetical protein ACJZ9F_11450 [Rhodospirillaceae bacterium]